MATRKKRKSSKKSASMEEPEALVGEEDDQPEELEIPGVEEDEHGASEEKPAEIKAPERDRKFFYDGQIPSVKDLVGDGFSPKEADKIIAGLQVLSEGPVSLKPFRGYRVTGRMQHGFWAAGRRFEVNKTVEIHSDDLNEAQMRELDNTDPRYLTVEQVGLDNE